MDFLWFWFWFVHQVVVRTIVRLKYPSMAVNENGLSEYLGLCHGIHYLVSLYYCRGGVFLMKRATQIIYINRPYSLRARKVGIIKIRHQPL